MNDRGSLGRSIVLGASGLVGRQLVHALERQDVSVIPVCFTHSVPGAESLDITQRQAVRELFADVRPSAVFLAVNNPGGVDRCEFDRAAAERLHVGGTEIVADAAARVSAHLIFYSSDYIFDGRFGPYSEQSPPSPICWYGHCKWRAEQIVRSVLPDALILRTTAVFGWDVSSTNLAMQVHKKLQAGQRIQVARDQWCNPTLAEYLAEVSVQLWLMNVSGTINVSGGTRVTRADFAADLARAMNLDCNLLDRVPTAALSGRHAARPLQGGFHLDKMTILLGTEPLSLASAISCFRRQWRSASPNVWSAVKRAAVGWSALL